MPAILSRPELKTMSIVRSEMPAILSRPELKTMSDKDLILEVRGAHRIMDLFHGKMLEAMDQKNVAAERHNKIMYDRFFALRTLYESEILDRQHKGNRNFPALIFAHPDSTKDWQWSDV
jgi:hypothetical protein